jgi:alpha-glucosidase (family GH31 glycosyl hydrolase)
MPGDGVRMGALFQRSLELIRAHQAPGGAYPASPNFSQYGFAWLRDGSFTAHAMDRAGDHRSAARFLQWAGEVIRRHGSKMESVVGKRARGEPIDEAEYCHTRFTLDGQEGADNWWNHQLDGYGTWLWTLARHVELTGNRALLDANADSVRLVAAYLGALWDQPNYDCWEEHREHVHPATLACLFGGLQAMGVLLKDPPMLQVADQIRAFVCANAVHATGGHLVKHIGTDVVDASLLWAAIPFGMLPIDDPVMERTSERIEADLWHGGVHRYLEDTYYGGGEWILLTAWLGWLHAVGGDRRKAVACRDWIESHASRAGELPEQVADHALFPDMVQPWTARWGRSAQLLLWSHAMYVLLCIELAERAPARPGLAAAVSIEHWPVPREGAYPSAWPERFPHRPEANEEVRLGVRTTPPGAAGTVYAQWNHTGGAGRTEATWEYAEDDQADRWLIRLPGGPAGSRVTYAVHANGSVAGPWCYDVADWRVASGPPRVHDDVLEFSEPSGTHLRLRVEADGTSTRFVVEPTGEAAQASAGGGYAAQASSPLPEKNCSDTRNGAAQRRSASPTVLGDAAGEHLAPLDLRELSWDLNADGSIERVRWRFASPEDEAFYGAGERFNALDQRGNTLDVHVYEQYKRQGRRTYLPVPWVLSSRGYGVVVHSSRYLSFDFAATDPHTWSLTADAPGLSWTLLRAATPQEILKQYADLGGHAAVPPDWAFGPWMSSNDWNNQARVAREVAAGVALAIPSSVVVLEAWSDESTFYIWNDAQYTPRDGDWRPRLADFQFSQDGLWPDPKRMIDDLHARGIRVLLWQVPVQKRVEAPHPQQAADEQTMLEHGFMVREADDTPYRHRGWWFPGSLVLDVTNPSATDWWLGKRAYLLDDLQIDGFKTDGGEHVWGRELRFADGTSGAETCNRYPVLYSGAYHSFAREHRGEALTFSRAGFAGAQAYPCHWAGDEDSTWAAFRHSILAGLNAGLSGIPFWGFDIAGFSGDIPSAELYIRATAMATFCPIMQYHSEYCPPGTPNRDRTPWNIAERTGDRRVVDLYGAFARLRMRLIPYIVDQAAACAATGQPLMRAMPLAFPDEPDGRAFPFQYLFGDDFLVCPVVRPGQENWAVYLPRGAWCDAWTGTSIQGGQTLVWPAPLDRPPIFTRGSALPAPL